MLNYTGICSHYFSSIYCACAETQKTSIVCYNRGKNERYKCLLHQCHSLVIATETIGAYSKGALVALNSFVKQHVHQIQAICLHFSIKAKTIALCIGDLLFSVIDNFSYMKGTLVTYINNKVIGQLREDTIKVKLLPLYLRFQQHRVQAAFPLPREPNTVEKFILQHSKMMKFCVYYQCQKQGVLCVGPHRFFTLRMALNPFMCSILQLPGKKNCQLWGNQ